MTPMTSIPSADDERATHRHRPTSRAWSVLVVGQTPPPYHGQGMMLRMFLSGEFATLRLHHVRMAFSRTMDEVGRFRIAKLFHLIGLVTRILYARVRYGAEVLYYPPAGPSRIPMWRDFVILGCTRWAFRKLILHMHASGVSEVYPRLNWFERWLFRRAYYHADAVIRSSEFTAADGKLLHARREFIVPNATPDDLRLGSDDPGTSIETRAVARKISGPHILYLSTVCRTKGILLLLEACEGLRKRGRRFHLDIVGSFQPATFEAEVRQAIETRGLGEQTTIWGQQIEGNKRRRFREADLFCFPTYYESEGFPCVLVEALSYGLPVVSTRWRGIPSIVGDGKQGILVAPEQAEALELALEELLSQPETAQSMGRAGREKYLNEFTPEAHLRAMEDVFLAVRGDRRKSSLNA